MRNGPTVHSDSAILHISDWDDIRYFLNAVRAGSYTAAADRMNVNRTTIGRRLAHLEATLGVSLYEQTEEGYRPTPAGHVVLESGRAMESIADDLARRLVNSNESYSGIVRIATSAGIGAEFMPQIFAFRARFPDVRVEMLSTSDAIRSVRQRKADLALCLAAYKPGHLLGLQVCKLDQALYASKACIARNNGAPEWDRIGWGHEMASLPDRWIRANVLAESNAVFEVNSWTSLKEAVSAGIGAAYLWCFAADRASELVQLKPPDNAHSTSLWLLHREEVPPDAPTRALSNFLVNAIARHCAP